LSDSAKVILYEDEKECCGCESCTNICPKNAISMVMNKYGFLYPEVNNDLCINCNMCKSVCANKSYKPISDKSESYVAVIKSNDILLNSASGGVAYAISKNVINNNGVVFGAAMEFIDDTLVVRHIGVSEIKDLKILQDSKYMQSRINNCYNEVKEYLRQNRFVLFIGTPCQAAGLKGFLGYKNYDKLFIIDIICHGVPSQNFFNSYIKNMEKSIKKQIINFRFRDKSLGNGCNAKYLCKDKKGFEKSVLLHSDISSYYSFFLEGKIYRDSCYCCKYAQRERVGDLTIGDYWGVGIEHPEYMTRNGGHFDEAKGVSSVIVNNSKGEYLMEKYGFELTKEVTSFENIAKWNHQLNNPVHINDDERKKILYININNGYKAVETYFRKKLGLKYYAKRVKYMLKDIKN